MASVKIPMDSIDSICYDQGGNNSVAITFKKGEDIKDPPHTLYIADSQYTLVIDGNSLVIEQ